MAWSVPRIRSAVLATRPLRPYAHQDDAVFGVMLSQPRLRFLLADEPGTGKTGLMTGMYLAEGRRRELILGKTIIVVPAHLVKKWIRELQRFLGIDAPITPEIGRDPLDLRADVDVWIVSLDLYTHNPDVRRKVVGTRASWSLAVFDEAHRLTPTSQYLGAAAQLAELSHHLLLLTATPHRGKEHYFRALLHLLDPGLYPWDSSVKDYGDMPQRPGRDNFLRRMKEDLRDLDGNPLFPPRFAETRQVHLTLPRPTRTPRSWTMSTPGMTPPRCWPAPSTASGPRPVSLRRWRRSSGGPRCWGQARPVKSTRSRRTALTGPTSTVPTCGLRRGVGGRRAVRPPDTQPRPQGRA